MKLFFIICLVVIIIFILLILINNCVEFYNKKVLFKDYFSIDKDEFLELHKNKDVIIFSSGATFNEIKKYLHIFTPEFYNKYCIFAIKDTAIELDKLGVKVDAFLFNTTNYKYIYNNYKFKNSNKVYRIFDRVLYNNFILNFFKNIWFNMIRYDENKSANYMMKDHKDNLMKCIVDDKKDCLTIINNRLRLNHIVEFTISYSILLNPENIYILGWDTCITKHKKLQYFNKENFNNNRHNIFNTFDDFMSIKNILKFTKYLPKYLKKYYNINIYKLSDKQCIHLPLYDINKL